MFIAKELIDTLEVEQNIISCILQKPKLIYDVTSKIDKSYFQEKESRNHNRALFAIMVYLSKEKDMEELEFDAMTILSIAKNFEKISRVLKNVFSNEKDFIKYIETLKRFPINAKNWDYHVDELIKVNLVNDIITRNKNFNYKLKENYGEWSIDEIINKAESGILRFSNKYSGNKDDEPERFGENIVNEYENRKFNPNQFVGLPTPFDNLNKFSQGVLRKGSVTIVNAESGAGKSIILKNIAKFIGIDLGKPVYLGANEMTKKEQKDRLVAEITGYPIGILENGYYNCPYDKFEYGGKEYITEEVHKNVIKALKEVEDAPIFLDQIQGYNKEKLVQKAKYFKTRHNIEAFIWDYVKESAGLPSGIPLRHSLADVVLAMKESIADPLGIPVLTASQAKPHSFWMSAESYGIEKFCTCFLLLRKLSIQEQNDNPLGGEHALTIKKNRYGKKHKNYETQWINFDFDKKDLRFEEVN